MLNSLLAFDSIVPMTGSVVLAGAFSFLGGVFLARKSPEDPLTPINRLPEPELEAEIQRLSQDRLRQSLVVERQSQELCIVREMLELRAIIDSQSGDSLETLERFANRLCESTQADRAAIYFVARRAGEQLQPIVQCGLSLSADEHSTWCQHEQVLARLAIGSEQGGSYDEASLRNLQLEGTLRNLLIDSPIRSAATMPIRVNGRVLGAICLTRQGNDGALEKNRNLIEFGAEILSHTLRRVFDEATIRRQARHDHLTDLVNRRSFDVALATEIDRVHHGESPVCSLILADLDRFKSYNDRFGHQGGDQVLRTTARVLAEQVSRLRMGEQSIVARYGGEEFAILLPNVGQAGALRIAEGIRTTIEHESIPIHDLTVNVTVSLGVAVCSDRSDSTDSLVAAADKALYRAKSSGRNCVCHQQNDAERENPASPKTTKQWDRLLTC